MTVSTNDIQHAKTEEQILRCFELLHLLRPHLLKEAFVDQVREQEKEGYQLLYIQDHNEIKSVVGYRIGRYLAWGKTLYIDDLITSPEARGTGFGTHLIKWLMGEAKKQGCDSIHLDTGIERDDAHRLYLNLGLKIDCLHLSMKF